MRHYLLLALLILVPAATALADPVTIRILHLNDFHGSALPTAAGTPGTALGGAPRLARKLHALRRQHPALVLAAGDMLLGDGWAAPSQGKGTIELLNLLGVDALLLGRDDFSLGPAVLSQRISEAALPILAANLSGLAGTLPRIYFNRAGIRIAVIGLMDETLASSDTTGTLTGLKLTATLESARDQIAESELTADLIVLLTHQGYERDLALAQALCAGPRPETPVPVLIVGGGSHTRLQRPQTIGNCVVVQAWEHGKALGQVDLTMEAGTLRRVTGQLHEITPALGTGSPAMQRLIRRHQPSQPAP